MHRRLSDLTTSRAKALLRDGADLVAEDIARAAKPAFRRTYFQMKGNPVVRSREGKNHYPARGTSVKAV